MPGFDGLTTAVALNFMLGGERSPEVRFRLKLYNCLAQHLPPAVLDVVLSRLAASSLRLTDCTMLKVTLATSEQGPLVEVALDVTAVGPRLPPTARTYAFFVFDFNSIPG